MQQHQKITAIKSRIESCDSSEELLELMDFVESIKTVEFKIIHNSLKERVNELIQSEKLLEQAKQLIHES